MLRRGSDSRLTCHQQQPLGLRLHLGPFAVLLICAAVQCLTGLMNDSLLQVQLVCQNLQEQKGTPCDEPEHVVK